MRTFLVVNLLVLFVSSAVMAQVPCRPAINQLNGQWVLRLSGVAPVEQTVPIVEPVQLSGPSLDVTGSVRGTGVEPTHPDFGACNDTGDGPRCGEIVGRTDEVFVASEINTSVDITTFEPFWRLCRLVVLGGNITGNSRCRGSDNGEPVEWFPVTGSISVSRQCHMSGEIRAIADRSFDFWINGTMAWQPALVHGFMIEGLGSIDLDSRPAHQFVAQRTSR
jgi:hypothetical protein